MNSIADKPISFVCTLIIAGGILFSYFSFSYSWYPFINSDAALAVIMSHDYQWPHDIYCWGQNRGGTLEMLIAHFFISLFNAHPLTTASIVHFSILTLGLLAGFHFVKKPFTRIGLTIAWFFPSSIFIESILYQFSVQFSLFVIGLFFLSRLKNPRNRMLNLSLFYIYMILNCWVLDLGLIPLIALVIFAAPYFFSRKNSDATNQLVREFRQWKYFFIALAWTIAGGTFILYAKHITSIEQHYTDMHVSNWKEIFSTLSSIGTSLFTFLFKAQRPAESIYCWSAIIFLLAMIIHTMKSKSQDHFFQKFFLWQAIFSFVVLVCMKQVLVNDVPIRYFTGTYLSLAIYLLVCLEEKAEKNLLLNTILVVVLLSSCFTSLAPSYIPGKLRPMTENFPVLEKLKPVGIIGSYWNSYVFGAIDPEKIKATPHDGDQVRNIQMTNEVLHQPRILLVRNEWLDDFPDSIVQFKTQLLKSGEPFMLGYYYSWNELNQVFACEYRKPVSN